jgi:hypothetical protein
MEPAVRDTYQPFMEVLTHSGRPDTTVVRHAVIGRLQGFTGSDEYGIAAGADLDAFADNWLVLSEDRFTLNRDLNVLTTKGFQFTDGGTNGWVLTEDGSGLYVPGAASMEYITGGDAEFVVMSLTADLPNERVLTAGDGISVTDGGAGSTATVAVDLVAAWSGLEFSGGDLRIDQDAAFTWTAKHTFTLAQAIEIDTASGDPSIVFDTQGADKFTLGVDDSDSDKFKINSGGSLADPSDFELDSSGNVEIGGNLTMLTGTAIIHADGGTAGWALVDDGAGNYSPGAVAGSGAPVDAEYVVMSLDATLTAERVLTAGDSITLADGGAGGNATLNLDTPGTLTVATGNASGAPHTHAITSSSNPGAAASILATDATGGLQITGTLNLAEFLGHAGDANTYIQFQADRITLHAGGADMIDLIEAATDYVQIPTATTIIGGTAVDSRVSANLYLIDGDIAVSQSGAEAVVNTYSYGNTPQGEAGAFRGRRARGTRAAPSAVQNGDMLGRVGSGGYGATGFSVQSTGYMQVDATEAWDDSSYGTQLSFITTPDGTTNRLERIRIQEDGTVYVAQELGIGTLAVPHGSIGIAMLALEGANNSVAGPHIQLTTASDNYPLVGIYPLTHDNATITFDAYYSGGWKSSDAGSNFRIAKTSDLLVLSAESSIAASNAITWVNSVVIDASGQVGIQDTAPGSLMEWNFSTEDLEFVNAGSAGATEQDWIEVQVGGVTGYIRVYASV